MATLKDIAERAGVNKSTVSRALSGNKGISEDRRQEILKIANDLGYIPNETAKVLAGKKARTIGIILPEIDCNYYASVVGTIENRLKERGYSLIIGQTGFKLENELHYLKLFAQKNLDGIIFSVYNTNEFTREFETIKKHIKIPVVFIESYVDLADYDVIEIDNWHGLDLVIDHLTTLGHNKIGFISEYLSSKIRMYAFEDALKKRGFSVDNRIIKVGDERLEEGGYLRMKEMLSEKDRPTAVFASYDNMALGALKAAAEFGLEVPGDISIIGFDNIRESAYFNVPLTTVAPPVVEMGVIAVNTLLDKIEKVRSSFIQHISLKPALVERNSTQNIKK